MSGQRSRTDVAEALASALVLADLSEPAQRIAFDEQVRVVAGWAQENDDETLVAMCNEIRAVLESIASAPESAAEHTTLIGQMIEIALEAPEPEALPVVPQQNVYTQDRAVVEDFVGGAREQLDEAEALLAACSLEGETDVHSLFRCFHTLKGIAGFMSLDAMAQAAHEIESDFEVVRSGDAEADEELIERALGAVDRIRLIVDEVAAGDPEQVAARRVERRRGPQRSGTVRVDARRLDDLLDAMGELAVSEAEIAAALRHSGDDSAIQSLDRFQRIVRTMQATTTSLRMVDLYPTFRKMSRVVRDVIAHSGKSVEFVVAGGETEIDRQIVEGISDPLVHLLRNAVDHGIESPAERLELGKPQQGRVELRAFHRAGNVVIEVADDGRGIDREALVRKAEALGVGLEGADALELMFQPGVSTAASVTETSGRGVGMDAVANSIAALRGQLDVRSETGQGTTFTIRLPLTLAVIEAIVLRAGDERFVVPTQFVDRTASLTDATLVSAAGREDVLVLGDERLAVVRLDVPLGGSLLSGDVAVILDDGDQRFAILVDEVVGQQSLVVKPLSGPAVRANGVSGATLMGDGRAALVLDPVGIVRAMRGRW